MWKKIYREVRDMERSIRFSSFLLKLLAVVALVGFAGLHTAKADALTPSGTGAACTGNPDPTNTNVICFTGLSVTATNSGAFVLTTTDTLYLYQPDASGLSLALICTASCASGPGYIPSLPGNSAELFGAQAFGGTLAAPTTTGSSCVVESKTWSQCVQYTSGTKDWVQGGNGGNNPADGGGSLTDTYALISNGSGNYDINSASIDLKFSLGTTTTPEPSSLLMLGSGLLGLLGLGLRRSNIG
jgi:hypothetical protein